ncbi:MAG: class I tRNA ligase family protein, partial [Myxococcota bacterium]
LRLLHPFRPFITEVIWEALAAQAPRRGIEEPFERSELCIEAAWPTPRPGWIDRELEAEFERLRDVLRVIRDLRSSYRVPRGRALPCAIRASGDALASLERLASHIRALGSLSELHLGEGVGPLARAATQGLGELEISLGSVLDPVRERERLEKGRARIERQLEASRRKLANEKFVSRARPEVVDAERQRLREAELELARLGQSLAQLDSL